MSEPVEWRNQLGKSYWQPCTYDGDRLWTYEYPTEDGPRDLDHWIPAKGGIGNLKRQPKLYRSKKRAERIARRLELRQARHEMHEVFLEVK